MTGYSKWSQEFVGQYKETGTVKRLTKEINEATSKKDTQKEMDQILKEVIQGKYKRRGY